jgi:hypothetical protein
MLERTPTDNATVAVTCAVRRLVRWRARPIWLCKQVVNGRGLHRPCRARPADWSLVAENRSAGGDRDRTGPDNPLVHAGSA